MTAWPMPVADFVAGGHLRRSDVVLGGGKTIFSRLLKEATGSDYSHAGLVFAVPNAEDGFDKAFVLESSFWGVDITDLQKMARPGYCVAIKRLEAPWFTPEMGKLVRGHMLNYIKASYDFWSLAKMVCAAVMGYRYDNPRATPARFLCAGFVQHGFAETVQMKCPWELLDDVIFTDRWIDRRSSDLLSVTPEELAATPKLAWKYAIAGGLAHEVSTGEQAREIFRAGR